ncbi:MAG: lysoplasmalogenase [Rhodanobacteraceae bacterium]|nr:lysoplasmalogenase [Rhodanobacteraceae bacterium]
MPTSTSSAAASPLPWAAAVAAAAILAVLGALVPGLLWLHYLAKPLATLLIAALVWCAVEADSRYRRAVLAGLFASTLGDVWLMLPWDAFVAGLASFLLAHLAYLVAFTGRRALLPLRWPWFAYALLAAAVLALLWPGLPDALRLPVVVYVVALAAMAVQAATIAIELRSGSALLAGFGGFGFVVSDGLLAIDRFHTPLPVSALWVLTSYWIAQFLIGRSVWHSRR